jgi:hypothetical protein
MAAKVVAFDVDETLGNFSQFSYFGHTLGQYFNKPDIMYRYFNDLVDLYPEIIRPNMVRILDYIRKKKNAGVCSKVMIYTNNMGPDKWVAHIRSYFENKLRSMHHHSGGGGKRSAGAGAGGLLIVPPLFDHTIGGFKPHNERTASASASASAYPERTTTHKTVNEFIRCGRLPSDIEICFLDDVEHPKMVDERVYYIKLQAYHSYIPFEMFVVRFLNSALYRDVFSHFQVPSIIPGTSSAVKSHILSIEMNNLLVKIAEAAEYDVKANQQKVNPREIDEIISKYILYHLQQFFRDGLASTTHKPRNKTSKKNSRASSLNRRRVYYIDKNTAVKNMKNKTIRNR